MSLICVCSCICEFVKMFAVFCGHSMNVSRCSLGTSRQTFPFCFCSSCLFLVPSLLVLLHVSVSLLSFSPVLAPFPWSFYDHDAVCPVPCSSAPSHCGQSDLTYPGARTGWSLQWHADRDSTRSIELLRPSNGSHAPPTDSDKFHRV